MSQDEYERRMSSAAIVALVVALAAMAALCWAAGVLP